MLRLEAVGRRYGERPVLAGLDLEVAEGEFLALLGPSGSGKSTLLRIVAGLDRPDRGRVWIGGRDVTDTEPSQRGVAMVFQSFALFPHLTVAENIGFGLTARRTAAGERRRRVAEAAAVLGLEPVLERRPGRLSGGERQRVALARALAGRPRVLLLDEPLSNLDAPLREQARDAIRRLHAQTGATVVHVTHDQAEALSLGQRVAVLEGGALRQVGTPDEVYDRPADLVVAAFVGSPAMNLVKVRGAGGTLRGAGELVLPPSPSGRLADGEAVVAGFRAEGVQVVAWPPAADDGPVFPAVLEVVERAGHERLWTLRTGETRLVVRVGATATADVGQTVGLRVAPDAVRLFDARTGRAR